MPWQYHQTSGQLFYNGHYIKTGYSGHGPGKNNPMFEATSNVGPIPTGRYTIGSAFTHEKKGSVVMRLTPVGHMAHGRTGFLIHGDSIKHPGEGSEGCIVVDRSTRNSIEASRDTILEVVQ